MWGIGIGWGRRRGGVWDLLMRGCWVWWGGDIFLMGCMSGRGCDVMKWCDVLWMVIYGLYIFIVS